MSWRQIRRRAVQFAALGGPVGEIGALSPKTAALAKPGQAPLGLLLVEIGVNGLADQGALAAERLIWVRCIAPESPGVCTIHCSSQSSPHPAHQGLAGAGDHHLLPGQGLVDVAGKVGLGVVEVDLQRWGLNWLSPCCGLSPVLWCME